MASQIFVTFQSVEGNKNEVAVPKGTTVEEFLDMMGVNPSKVTVYLDSKELDKDDLDMEELEQDSCISVAAHNNNSGC